MAYGSLGIAYYSLGNFQKALEYHERNLKIAKEWNDRSGEGKAYGNLGNAHHSLGDFERAMEYYHCNLKIAKELGDRRGEGAVYGNIGIAHRILGDFKKAVDCHERHLKIAKEVGDRSGEGKAYVHLGNTFHSLGDFQKAIDFHERYLKISIELGDRSGEGAAYGNLGNAHCSLGNLEISMECYERHLKIARELGDRSGQGKAYGNLGNAFRSLGVFEKAIENYERRLKIAKEVGDRSGEGKAYGKLGCAYHSLRDFKTAIDYLERNLKIARELGDPLEEAITCSNLGSCYEGLGQVLVSIEYYQLGITLLNNIRDCRQLNDDWKISLREQYQVTYAALWRLMLEEGKIKEALYSAEQGRAQGLKDLIALNYGFEMNDAESGKQHTTAHELFSRVPPNTIFMAISGQSELILWVFHKEKEVELRRKQINFQLERELELVFGGIEHRTLETLYDDIIDPIKDLLSGNELIFVPEGPLCLLPFAACKDPNSKYLCESFRIRVAPSLTSFKMIADCPVDYHRRSGVLLVGDPWVQEVTQFERLVQLPYAREEVEMIGRMLGCTPLIGKQASKVAVLRRLSSAALVHIAAHSHMETGEIALAPDIGEMDSILTMKDVKSVQMRARLVVLSCCNTARGKIKSEGVVGIARAFLGAGARSVLVSLWAIDDEATFEFMKIFYQHLVKGKSASEALNRAMNGMRESEEFGEVKYWAPFVLIGDDVTLDLSGCE